MTLKVIQCHIRPLLCQIQSSTFVYEPILMKICMNANIMKTQFFHRIIYDLKCHFYIMKKFVTFLQLTYVLMDNFCSCFFISVHMSNQLDYFLFYRIIYLFIMYSYLSNFNWWILIYPKTQ